MNRKTRSKSSKGRKAQLKLALANAEKALLDGAFIRARQLYEKIVRSDPKNLSAWANLGAACLQMEDADAAKYAFFEALAIEPNSVPILVNLATLLNQTGASGEASRYYRRALQLSPTDAEIWHDFSRTKRFEKDDPDITSLHKLAGDLSLKSDGQMHAHYALGKALEDIGNYDAAFDSLRMANQIARKNVHFDLPAEHQFASKIIETFNQKFFAERMGAGNCSSTPILIVGMPRSGTTLIEQILSSHPDVHGGGERNDLQNTIAEMIPQFPKAAASKWATEYAAIGESYVSRLNKVKNKTKHITDKMPRNFYFLGVVGVALPNVRIIHCKRSPIDTCLSCFALHFPYGQEFAYDLRELGGYFNIYNRLMAHWHRVMPGRILDLNYEMTVKDLEGEARRILQFCGLQWQDECLKFYRTKRQVATASSVQVREPIHSRSVDRWLNFEKHLVPLREALGLLADDGLG